jgi:predicted nucleic acid-binding protein
MIGSSRGAPLGLCSRIVGALLVALALTPCASNASAAYLAAKPIGAAIATATTASTGRVYDYDGVAPFARGAPSSVQTLAALGISAPALTHGAVASRNPGPSRFLAAEGGTNVILDTNAVFNRAGVDAALRSGETPVVTQTTRAELANLVASGRVAMPRYAGELRTIPDVMDVDLRINIRGAMRPGQRGLFGDGAIGATAVRTGSPVITADRNFASVLESLGVEVRIP